MRRFFLKFALSVLFITAIGGCNSSAVQDVIDIIEGVPRKTINTDILGINAFANDGRFGTPQQQYTEVRSVLRLNSLRILANWDALAQPAKGSPINFSFLDTLVAAIPDGVDGLIILSGTPTWMSDASNWTDGDPKKTFVREWVTPIVRRYRANPKIIGFQVWNEPNQNNQSNRDLGLVTDASGYVEVLRQSFEVIRNLAPSKLVVTAATTSLNQNFPDSLDYNRMMRDAGAQQYADIWAIHYYGKQYENLLRPGGVKDFVNGLSLPVWVTESGERGVNKQLAYGEEVWHYLVENMPSIQRIYVYQHTEATPPESTYGLRNLSSDAPVSDLYVWLRDR
jgi:hypothetical protein